MHGSELSVKMSVQYSKECTALSDNSKEISPNRPAVWLRGMDDGELSVQMSVSMAKNVQLPLTTSPMAEWLKCLPPVWEVRGSNHGRVIPETFSK